MAMRVRALGGWLNLVLSAALALAAWGLVTVLSTQPTFKHLWDFSPQARFSVEPATEELLTQLRDSGQQVEIHTIFYPLSSFRPANQQQRQQLAIQQRLQELTHDLLRQYSYLGGDALTVTHHDLLGDPGDVREVLREIQNRRYNSVIIKVGRRNKVLSLESDMAEIDGPGLGSSGSAMPGGAQRPVVLKDYKGEEAISTALKLLLVEGTPKVYLLQGYSYTSLDAVGTSYSELLASLDEEGFDSEFLEPNAQHVPDDASIVVLLNATRELLPRTADMLYQFLRRGGRVLMTVQYYEAPSDYNVSLRALGERLGFEISDELVCHAIPDPNNPRNAVTGMPECQNLVAANLSRVHPVTRPLAMQGRLPRFKGGREVRAVPTDTEGVRVDTSLLVTGPSAWLEARPVDYIGPQQPVYQPRSIGAVIDVDGVDGARAGHLVLIAAEGLDNLSFQFNGDLALNLFNWMSEREALISVRGERYVSRKLEATPPQLDAVERLLVLWIPGLLLILGLVVFWRRSRV